MSGLRFRGGLYSWWEGGMLVGIGADPSPEYREVWERVHTGSVRFTVVEYRSMI